MLRRITEMWPNLLGRQQNQLDLEDNVEADEKDVDQATEEQLAELRAQTLDIYKNLYWTRVISIHNQQIDAVYRWPVGPDIADAHDELFTIDNEDLPELQIYFDPAAFQREHPQPEIAAWTLSEPELRKVAVSATKIRKSIKEKAREVEIADDDALKKIEGPNGQ